MCLTSDGTLSLSVIITKIESDTILANLIFNQLHAREVQSHVRFARHELSKRSFFIHNNKQDILAVFCYVNDIGTVYVNYL